MFHLIHRGKGCHRQEACSTTAHGMAVELVPTTAAPHTHLHHSGRPLMYSHLPSSASGAASRRSAVTQLLADAALLSARCFCAATALTLLLWLVYAGPLHWRIQVGHNVPAAVESLYDARVWGSMLLRDMVFLWGVPTAMALSAVAVLVLQPLSKHRRALMPTSTSAGMWASRLLPPRCAGLNLTQQTHSRTTLDAVACSSYTVGPL